MSTPRRRLIVLFGGRSAEHEVSCTSARHVLAAIDPDRYDVEPIGIRRDGTWVRAEEALAVLGVASDPARLTAADGAPLPARLDAEGPEVDPLPALAADELGPPVVFPLLHGPMGEDGTVQGLLELCDVPYVGTGVLGSALCMDKIATKDVLDAHGIPQARWRRVHAERRDAGTVDSLIADLGLPVFVKPANMGSSVGVSRAVDAAGLAEALDLAAGYDEWIVIEEAVSGREIECAVLGNLDPEASVPGEIRPGAEWYDYEDKYDDGAELLIPAPLDDDVATAIRTLAVEAYRACRCEGLARVDFFLRDDGEILVNEINTMPGFTPISMYPKMWQVSGLSYPALVDRLVELAIERHARRSAHRRTDR